MPSKKADPYANLGEFIRRQRELAQLSVRQLADMSARQREMLIDMYRSFRKVNEAQCGVG